MSGSVSQVSPSHLSLSAQGLEHPQELHRPCASWGTVLGESFLPCLHRSKWDEDTTKQGLTILCAKELHSEKEAASAHL